MRVIVGKNITKRYKINPEKFDFSGNFCYNKCIDLIEWRKIE